MALAGPRLGEALALKWPAVDCEHREIRVARTLAPSAKGLVLADRLGTPKSGKARTVDMKATFVDVFREHEQAAKAAALRRGAGGTLPEFVFTTQMHGVPLDDRRVREVFAQILRRAGLATHHTPHCLRHTFCTLLLAEGVPVTYVMTQAGHSSIDVTVRYYGRWIPKTDRSLIDRFNAKLAPARVALAIAGGGEPTEAGRLNPSQDTPGNAEIFSNSEGGALRPSIHVANSSGSVRRWRVRSRWAGCPERSRPRRLNRPSHPANRI